MGQLVNHTIKGFHQGVSQQPDEVRFETQCEEMVNCIPHATRGVMRRNPLMPEATNGVGITFSSDAYIYSYDRGAGDEKYIFVVEDGKYSIYDVVNSTWLVEQALASYLDLPVGRTPKDSFTCVTIADYTFIVNKTVETAMDTTVDGVANSHLTKAFYWVKKTTSVLVDSTTYKYTGYVYGITYPLASSVAVDFGASTTEDSSNASTVATSLASQLGVDFASKDEFVYGSGLTEASIFEGSDTSGGSASVAVKGSIRNYQDLPAEIPALAGDFLVKVEGFSEGGDDDYWLNWDSVSKSWVEDREPGLVNTLDASTMPHVFVRKSTGGFLFGEYEEVVSDAFNGVSKWGTREVGDENTAPNPSFIGNTISDMFFHKNRLGIISEDSIVLGELSEYGNYYPTSIKNLYDTDPIDLTVATTDVSKLTHAVPMKNNLVLFSPTSQFILTSNNQPLTPITATIDSLSNYNVSSSSVPRFIGNTLYYVSEAGGYSQLYGFKEQSDRVLPEAQQLSIHVPSYIPSNVVSIKGHSTLGFNFMFSPSTPKTLYVYNIIEIGGETAQASYHKWEFKDDIVGVSSIDNRMFIVFSTYIASINLNLPGDLNTSYLDLGTDAYSSNIILSKYYVKDNKQVGTRRGRLQIRTLKYSVEPLSYYMTTVVNETINNIIDENQWLLATGLWDDAGLWCDTCPWINNPNVFIRQFKNDDKVTVMGNSDITKISFSNNPDNPDKGFILSTVNYEAMFHQRSSRY